MIERDSIYCPKCSSAGPFGCQCPTCFKPITRNDACCSGCGRSSTVECPYCKAKTFIGTDKCDACGKSLMKTCGDKRCGKPQFFDSEKCTICGKKLKKFKK